MMELAVWQSSYRAAGMARAAAEMLEGLYSFSRRVLVNSKVGCGSFW